MVAFASCIILYLDLNPCAAVIFHLALAATDVGQFSAAVRIKLIVVGSRPATIRRVDTIVPVIKFPSSLLLHMSILLLLLFLRYVLRDALFETAIHNFESTDMMNLALEIVFGGHS
jgi:hypothetical protein